MTVRHWTTYSPGEMNYANQHAEVDACWGYLGSEYAKEELQDRVASTVKPATPS